MLTIHSSSSQNLPVPAQTHFKNESITMNSGSRCGLTCLSVTPAKLITAHMKENIRHDQCPSGGGKNKQSCFHSLPLTNIPLHTSASCHSAPWSALWRPVRQQWKTSRAAERKKVFRLENCLPSVLPVHKKVGIWGICKAVCYCYTVWGRRQT